MGNIFVIRSMLAQHTLVLARKIQSIVNGNFTADDKTHTLDVFYKILLKHSQGNLSKIDPRLAELIDNAAYCAYECRSSKKDALEDICYQLLILTTRDAASFSFHEFIKELITAIEHSPKSLKPRTITG